ncbi:MAG: GNAT family N-acetyltransferase [Trueperaceae bacterium]|nr:GNAT family N-acetyltransferase [Trueperaceae bacterium]
MQILETKRLLLRHFHLLDASALRAIFADPEVMRFGDGVQTDAWIRGWLEQTLANYGHWGFGPYALVKKENSQIMGYCGLFYFPELAGQAEVEIGYRLARNQWGKGYASEAALAVRDYAFQTLSMSRLVAMIDPGNLASLAVAKKLGMVYEKEILLEGYDHPDHLYVLETPK